MLASVSFTKRYVFALLLIALLSILAYYNLNHLISSQSNDGKIINLSSKQGMLSQQIALYAIYYKTENLKNNIVAMEEAHMLLLSFPMSEELKKVYFSDPHQLDKSVKNYLFHAKRFEENRDGRSLTYILQNSQKLLHDLDLATSIYVATTEANTKNLKNVEFFIFLFTLATLFFEALFIFRPANKRITETTNEIIRQKDYSNNIIEYNTNDIIDICLNHYYTAIDSGVKAEDARRIIPQAAYTTGWIGFNKKQLNSFLGLRTEYHAQPEIRELAISIQSMIG